ncbi:hypothetical protein [Paroceanicella profunda]|uniref:hypothetical protein n=1 Tax=Paroceanicella profunda TaxID=2579971 RepID=UPI0014788BED|nr:hypothetical protein [Paroceanicella profunda]
MTIAERTAAGLLLLLLVLAPAIAPAPGLAPGAQPTGPGDLPQVGPCNPEIKTCL